MQFVDLNNIEGLKEIFTPYVLTALKEKYMKTHQKICRDEINERYEKNSEVVDWLRSTTTMCYKPFDKISHCELVDINNKKYYSFTHDIADFPKRFKYTSGMNCPNGFKELNS